MIQLSIEDFYVTRPCHRIAQSQQMDWEIISSHKNSANEILHIQFKTTIMSNLVNKSFQFVLKVMEFKFNDIKIFRNTLC
jgi:hypothetical protein